MKKIISYLSLSLLAIGMNAQNYENEPAPNKTYKLFFEPNSYVLDDAAKSTLQLLNQDLEKISLSRISLQAATDDRGELTSNKLLAEDRAKAVYQFLLDQGYNKTVISIESPIFLTSDLAENSEERRRNHRSVLLRVWSEDNDISNKEQGAIEAFFAAEQQNAQEHFTFEAKTGMAIQGKKGTKLKVPADCFVYADGRKVEGTVIVTLQEALSYGDMMMQNLSTTSRGKILETGGMFYIAATDVQGNELKIKTGASIEAKLPTVQASLPGMQVFEAGHDANGNLDWSATNRAVQVNDPSQISENRFSQITYTLNEVEAAIEQLEKLTEKLSLSDQMPDYNQKAPKKPITPTAIAPDKPLIDDYYAKYTQGAKESDYFYRKRVQGKFKKVMKVYTQRKGDYDELMATYRSDSTYYAKYQEGITKSQLNFTAYARDLKNNVESVVQILEAGDFNSYRRMVSSIATPLNFKEYRLNEFFSKNKTLRDDIEAKIKEGHPFEPILEKLDKYGDLSFTVRDQWGMKHIFKGIDNSNISYRGSSAESDWIIKPNAELEDLKKELPEIKRLLSNGGNEKSTLKRLERFLKDYDKMGGVLLDVEGVATIKKNYIRNKNKVAAYIDMEKGLKEIRTAYLSKCAELGLLTPQQVSEVYISSMQIDNLGWINCDRFRDEKGPTADIEILVENQGNTTIYVVFEDINSVIKAEYVDGHYRVRNLPAGKKVKVIGIHITGQSAELFVEQTTVGKEALRPKFEAKSIEELKSVMARA